MTEEKKSNMRIKASGLSDVGRKRTRNEDSYFLSEECNLFVVADGMGGHSGGEFASRLAISTIEEVLGSMLKDPEATVISGINSDDANYGQKLKYAIEVAGQRIFDQALYDPELKGMGTTITSLMVDDDDCIGYVANVGDSRVYLIRQGVITQLTVDHSLVNEQKDSDLMSKDEIKKKYKNVITRSVGYQEDVEIDLVTLELYKDDKLLLCSDGLTNMVDDQQLLDIVTTQDVDNSCRELVRLANSNGGDDNVTVIVCEVVEGFVIPDVAEVTQEAQR